MKLNDVPESNVYWASTSTPVPVSAPSSFNWNSIAKAISDVGNKYLDVKAKTAAMKYDQKYGARQNAPVIPYTVGGNSNLLIYGGLALIGVFLLAKLTESKGGKK